jgi:hypothetical protein
MNDMQKRFFELTAESERLSEERKRVAEELEVVMTKLGLNTYHQDPLTGLVFKVVKPTGTFISFREIDYKRTAKPGEKGGTVLSKKEAEEAGFVLTKAE